MLTLRRKTESLLKYKALFNNWGVAALARYAGPWLGREHLLHMRDGRRFRFRPASDYIALGEVFCAESYRVCREARAVRRVWDIGGNIGLFTLWAAAFLPEAEFDSFEPCAETFALLEKNRKLNTHIRWKTHLFGLAAKTETVRGGKTGNLYGSVSRYSAEGPALSLPMKNVEEAWTELGCPAVDLLKIDCEGGEYDVLEAMPTALLDNVRMVVLELHRVEGKDPEKLARRLVGAGLTLDGKPSFSALLVARRT